MRTPEGVAEHKKKSVAMANANADDDLHFSSKFNGSLSCSKDNFNVCSSLSVHASGHTFVHNVSAARLANAMSLNSKKKKMDPEPIIVIEHTNFGNEISVERVVEHINSQEWDHSTSK